MSPCTLEYRPEPGSNVTLDEGDVEVPAQPSVAQSSPGRSGTLWFVTEALVSDPAVATSGDDRDLDKVPGHQEPRAGDWWARPTATALLKQATPDARLPMLLLAQLVAGIEANTGRSSWRTPSGRLARYFSHLESVGYGISDVERLVFGEEDAGSAGAA